MSTDSCFPELTSLDVFESVTVGASHSFSHKLKSTNMSGVFVTDATFVGSFDGERLNLGFRFEKDGVSLPYNIYAVLVATERGVLAWYDLTASCTGPGGSIFPGGAFDLPAVKFTGGGTFKLHLVVWGHL